MNEQKLNRLATQFYQEMQASGEHQGHQAQHQQRSRRAQLMLTTDRIPMLTEDDLRELFFDSDAFGFWRNKEWEFNDRLQSVGLDGLRQALLELVTRAERGLTAEDLKQVWNMRGLGTLFSTELLAYRFPERYWTFSANVTLPAFQKLDDDVKASMPRGQKSNAHLYMALEPRLARVRQALADAGFAAVDNLLVDIFVWWINQRVEPEPLPEETAGIPDVDAAQLEKALREFDARKRTQPDWASWESDSRHKYAIKWRRQLYPVKEVVRMATGAVDFAGAQARPYLEKRGFEVVPLRREATGVWMFQANPRIYDLETGLRRHKINDWQVNRYRREIRRGDRVVFWKAGENRGIYGLGTIVSDLYQRADGDSVMDVQYDERLKEPVLKEALADHPVLSQMLIMRQQQGTNFRVTPEEWAALEPLLGEVIPPDPDAIDARGIDLDGDEVVEPLMHRLHGFLASQGLHFTDWQIATFYTALQAKGFVILSGVSGTGKTKLAQGLATLLPRPIQPGGDEIVAPGEAVSVTVQPYMLKYGRLIIPKQATRLFDPPEPGEAQEITLTFDGQGQTCRLVHASYSNTDYLLLSLRGTARQWFARNLSEGDLLILEPVLDQDQNLAGFRLSLSVEQSQVPHQAAAGQNWLFVPVRPDWRDSKSLLGYFNPLTGTYEWTPFLRFLLRAAQSYRAGDGLAWFVILDEMNLAHVEYYFADLLSVLESGRDEEGWSREPLRLIYPDDAQGDLPPRRLHLPPNLYIVGTVNVDETTHAFSPKVLDRAFTLELTEADFSAYLSDALGEVVEPDEDDRQALLDSFTFGGAFTGYGYADKQPLRDYMARHPEVRVSLQNLNGLLRPYNLHFGYRVFDEILLFLDAAEYTGLFDDLGGLDAALDAAALMKVLPKFHGSRGKLEAPLRAVLAWCMDPAAPQEQVIADSLDRLGGGDDVEEALSQLGYRYPATATRARRMLWALYTDGFAAFG